MENDTRGFGESWRDASKFGLFLTREEAALEARISLASLDRAVRRNELPSKRIGRRRLFPRKAFEEWCNQCNCFHRPGDGDCAPCFFGLIGG
jgi:excisionase family DNA binding protein